MAGIVRTEAYPSAWDKETNPPPPIQGFTPEQTWAWYHPDPPAGYTWAEYVKAVGEANIQGEPGPRPLDAQGRDMAGGPDVSPQTFLQYTMGYGRLAPLVDQGDPATQRFLDSTYYANTATDDYNFFGDEFGLALLGLGGAIGGAAALGGFAPAAGAAGSAAAGAADIGGAGAIGGGGAFGAGAGAGAGGAGAGVLGAGSAAGAIGGGSAFGAAGAGAGALGSAAAGGGVLGTLGAIAPFAAPLIGAGTSILGGAIAGGAARDAAETQANAATQANQTLQDIYNQQRTDMLPYMGAGYAALGKLGSLADQPLTQTPYAATEAMNPGQYAFDPAQYAFTPPNQPLDPAQYAFTAPVQPLDPAQYAFKPPSGQEVLTQDPGYQFRVDQGMKALQGSAAAKGGLLSGNTTRGAIGLGQNMASQEYGKAYDRLLGQNQLDWGRAQYGNEQAYTRALGENQLGYGRAYTANQDVYNRGLAQNQLGYERALQGNQMNYGRNAQYNQDVYGRGLQQYQTNLGAQQGLRQQQFNELATLAGYGTNTLAQQGQLGANLGNQLAGNITGAGAAQAAGQVGSANNWATGLAGVGNAANQFLQYQMLQQLLAQRR